MNIITLPDIFQIQQLVIQSTLPAITRIKSPFNNKSYPTIYPFTRKFNPSKTPSNKLHLATPLHLTTLIYLHFQKSILI